MLMEPSKEDIDDEKEDKTQDISLIKLEGYQLPTHRKEQPNKTGPIKNGDITPSVMNLFNMTVKQEIKPRLEFRDPSSDELSDDTDSINSPGIKGTKK